MNPVKWSEATKVRVIFLIALLSLIVFPVSVNGIISCSAQDLGVPDPVVRDAALMIVDDLYFCYENADSPSLVEPILLSAFRKLDTLPQSARDMLTATDTTKYVRLAEGIKDVLNNLDSPLYVRQRCRSLATIAATWGVYDNEVARDFLEMITERLQGGDADEEPEEPQTEPVD